MTAAEAIDRAREAGVILVRGPGVVRVRGPKAARDALRPMLAPLAGEILRLLSPENRGSEGAPPTRKRASAERCDECGIDAWLSLVAVDGARTCIDCLTGRTAMRIKAVPL